MHVQIALKNPHTVFTNLDYIQGHVVLNLTNPVSISSIVVKLEGVSRTRLMSMGNPDIGERPKPRDELHKVLYKTKTVFPDPSMLAPTGKSSFVLQPGHYEYPFEYKIPFNNACEEHSSGQPQNLNLASLLAATPLGSGSGQRPSLRGAAGQLGSPQRPDSLRHARATLPPSLTAFPGMAEIRYFLKVTVGRKEFFKENPRVIHTFNFLPIEPPRMALSKAEAYARRQHEFNPDSASQRFKKAMSSATKRKEISPPKFAFDARLPNPPIITCNEKIPLRLLLKRLNTSSEPLYLNSLQIELIGYTYIRAHDTVRKESSSWVIMSRSNIGSLLYQHSVTSSLSSEKKLQDFSQPESQEEIPIDPTAWDVRIPNSVAPTFETCNISRKYDLEIRAGIGYGVNYVKNQVVLPLRLPVSVYSGIHPPPALLKAMSEHPHASTIPKKPLSEQAISNVSAANALKAGLTPSGSSQPTDTVQSSESSSQQEQDREDPPPSYEDAIAADIGPIDGPRDYQPPPVPPGVRSFEDGDEKGLRRRDS